MTDPPAATISGKAVASILLGVLALFLNLFAALPALMIGYYGLRQINASDGRLVGRRLCFIGLGLGLFVCIADVIGLFAAGMLSLRLNAARTECENNLRQLGLTSNMYFDEHKTYPPGTIPNAKLAPEQRLSWIVSLLPYYSDLDAERRKIDKESSIYYSINHGIDRTKAWDDDANRDAADRLVRAFLCPGQPTWDLETLPGPTSYIGIAGIGANAAELPLANPNSGFFGYDRTITRDDVTAGISTTMMTTETAWKNGPWAQGGFATVRGLDPAEVPYTGRGRPFGGLHPGIVNILYVDASVRHFRDSAPPEQFATLATLNRGTNADR